MRSIKYAVFCALAVCLSFLPRPAAAGAVTVHDKVQKLSIKLEEALLQYVFEGKQLRLGVVELESVTDGAKKRKLGKIISDLLTVQLVKNPRLKVIERQRLEAVLQEQNLSLTGVLDPATAMKVGNLLAVDVIVCGGVSELGEYYDVSVRGIDVELGNVLAAVITDIPRAMLEAPDAVVAAPVIISSQAAVQRDMDFLEAALVLYSNTAMRELRITWPARLEELAPKYIDRIPAPAAGVWEYDPRTGIVKNSAFPDLRPSQPRLNPQPLLDQVRKANIYSVLNQIRAGVLMFQEESGALPANLKVLEPYIGQLSIIDGGTWEYDPKTGRAWHSKHPDITLPK